MNNERLGEIRNNKFGTPMKIITLKNIIHILILKLAELKILMTKLCLALVMLA